jgi:hypothetical protein
VTPTELSLRLLRSDGWLVDVCQTWVPKPWPGHSKDLFGLIDLVAVRRGETMGVQTTSSSNYHARLNKLTDVDHYTALSTLRAAGWRIVIHGWRKSTSAGQACKHGRATCGCTWTLHYDTPLMEAPV